MLLTLLVGGVALESQVSLQGSRPINKDQIYYHRPGDQNVDARLWEDPFLAVQKHEKGEENPQDSISSTHHSLEFFKTKVSYFDLSL